jgi:hypothetical protein
MEHHGPAMWEHPADSWDKEQAVTRISAGRGLDRVARPKGLEPLTF